MKKTSKKNNDVTLKFKNNSELIDEIKNIKNGLFQITADSEADFIKLGNNLQNSYEKLDELINRAISITAVSDEKSENSKLLNLEEIINNNLKRLKDTKVNINSKLDHVNNITRFLDNLNSIQGEIESIARYLRAVALNIVVETVRSDISNKIFSIIAEEIKDLSTNIFDSAKKMKYNSENAKNQFKMIYTSVAGDIYSLDKFLSDSEISAKDSISQAEELIRLSIENVSQASMIAREIKEQVAKIVIGIQFHDSMRQRLEHIVYILGEIENIFSEMDEPYIKKSYDDDKLGSAKMMIVCQIEQLSLIIEEIDRIYSENSSAFDTIKSEIISLEQNLSRKNKKDDKSVFLQPSQKDPFDILGKALSKFLNFENKGKELIKEIKRTYDQALTISSNLSELAGNFSSLSQEANIKSLNALIAAAQISSSEGRTLSALAGEMKSLSTLADDFVYRVAGIINSVVENIDELKMNGDDKKYDKKITSICEILTMVSEMSSFNKTESENILSKSFEIRTLLDEASDGLTFIEDISFQMDLYREKLNVLNEHFAPWADASSNSFEAQKMMKEQYTMKKERSVHNDNVLFAVSKQNDENNENEEDWDNVELF